MRTSLDTNHYLSEYLRWAYKSTFVVKNKSELYVPQSPEHYKTVFCCHLVVKCDATGLINVQESLQFFFFFLWYGIHQVRSHIYIYTAHLCTRSRSPHPVLTLCARFVRSRQLFISGSSGDTSTQPTVNLRAGLCSVFLLTGLGDRVIKCLFPQLSDPFVCACLRWLSIYISAWGTKSHLFCVDRWRLNLRPSSSPLPLFRFKATLHI